jgi:hypothetical protein
MKELLETFSLEQILLFIVLLAIAIKGVVSWMDWAKARIKEKTAEQQDSVNARKELTDAIGKITREYEAMNEQMQKMNQTIALLIESDKDDIKAWITREHHYFCYDLGYIDDYSLDCLEKRFSHYKDEGGNSFIKDLMDEIRQLPRESTQRLYSDKTQEQEENRR